MSNEVVSWQERLAQEAKEVAANFKPNVGRISLKAGQMAYEGNPVPGNTINVVVVASAFENSLYENAYDPKFVSNPDCFALSLTGLKMVPDVMVPNPPSMECDTCPNLKWGSDPKGGRGKACKEVVRLVLLPVGNTVEAEAIAKSEMAVMKLSVTNVKYWGNYVQKLSATIGRPPWSVITEIKVLPDPKTQFRVEFREQALVTDDKLLDALSKRIELAQLTAMAPYDSLGRIEEEAPAAPAATGKKKKKF